MRTAMRAIFAIAVLAAGAVTGLSCSVNDYCLQCATGDGGGGSDSGSGSDAGMDGDADVDAGCIPTGAEECDGKDNDCNGLVDDGVLPGVGDLCSNQMGECAGGVQECTNGTLKCTKMASPEVCDGLDNNCNGMIDEGDPSDNLHAAGSKCGTEVGECIAGQYHCNAATGMVECYGAVDHSMDPELCDGKDNDCDMKFDEDINLGGCGPTTNEGECQIGTLECQGGAPVCMNAVFPQFETCNGKDDDCDTKVDEIFNLSTDVNNCGACGNKCQPKSKTCINTTNNTDGTSCTTDGDCTGGSCVVNSQPRCNNACTFQCNVGFKNLDGVDANGCEYHCFATGTEECDGFDNDCDGNVDEGLTPPPICLSGGECGMTAPAAQCTGSGGWTCTYLGDVQFPETKCDGKNNDCDANIDEGQPNLGVACDNGKAGVCKTTGKYACNAADLNGPAVCDAPANVTQPSPEACDDQDNDCDNKIDEGGDTGDLLGQVWVDIGGGKQMMKYEASKPDSTETDQGARTTIACSKPDALPWTNVTYPQALAACQAIGATLCDESTWHRTCSVVSGTSFPIAASGSGTLIEAETYSSIAYGTIPSVAESGAACTNALDDDLDGFVNDGCPVAGADPESDCSDAVNSDPSDDSLVNDGCPVNPPVHRSWVPDYTAGFSSISAMEATPNTGIMIPIGNAVTQAPHVDYLINFTTSGTYHVWLKMYSNKGEDNQAYVGIGITTPVTPTNTVLTSSNGVWQWRDAGSFSVNTTGDHTVSVYMGEDGVKIDQIYLVIGSGTPPNTVTGAGNKWAFATNPTTYVGNEQTCNGDDYDTNGALAGDQDDIIPTMTLGNCRSTVGGGVFDMSGNVKEWTLAHAPGENPIRGGASNNTGEGISCPLDFTLADDAFYFPNIGFRCCR